MVLQQAAMTRDCSAVSDDVQKAERTDAGADTQHPDIPTGGSRCLRCS